MNFKDERKVIGYNLKLDIKEAKALQKVLREVIENDDIRRKCPNEIGVIDALNSLLYRNIVD